ncbi:MAG: BatA domain-containing protein, partial [Hyphomicrobiaceae bacterium]|nr:BatA domain-containing protein [Hyphomicrobiaceae bacterium]
MSLLPIGFLSPWILLAVLVLPVIWWLLRITPPAPEHVFFPATRLLLGINKEEQDSAHSPWWLTLLRLLAAAAIIFALARPVLNPQTSSLDKSDLLVVLVDNGWASAGNWGERFETLMQLLDQAEQQNRPVIVKATTDPDSRASFTPISAFAARKKLAGLVPQPFAPERLKLLKLLEKNRPADKKIS